MDEKPPEDSIFNLPPYRASMFSNSSSSNVQMDPAAAMQQFKAKAVVNSVIRGVSMAIVVLAMIGGSALYMLKQAAPAAQASIDLKHAIMGSVSNLNAAENTFTLTNSVTEDPTIQATGIASWTIQLPPGASLTRKPDAPLPACYTISSLEHNLNEAMSVSCQNFLQPGAKVVVEYLIIKQDTASMISKKIIREE